MNTRADKTRKLDEYWHLLYKMDFAITRQTVLLAILVAALLVALFISGTVISSLSKQNAELSRDRTMIGLPNGRGLFVSTDKVPELIISRFAAAFAANFFNYTPESVEVNLDKARGMMTPHAALNYGSYFAQSRLVAKRDAVSQRFDVKNSKLEVAENGYVACFDGVMSSFSGNTPLHDPQRKTVVVWLTVVPFTESTPEGLEVGRVSDKEVCPIRPPKPGSAALPTVGRGHQ